VASNPDGMVLFSGPTGSGKTTSLYALLQFLNQEKSHIITIENPVEYSISEFTQMDVNMHLTFPSAMRAALRMDPDVIMVGEIRDEESAQIASRAGESGHMVLSTVHANSAAEIITRLLKLGVQGFEMAPLLSVLVAQRLVKRIAPGAHTEWSEPNDIESQWLKERNLLVPGMLLPRVNEADIDGRIPLIEMIEITPEIKRIIEEDAGKTNIIDRIVECASRQPQFETLSQAGVRLAMSGKTTLEIVMRSIKEMSYIPKTQRFERHLLMANKATHHDIEAAWIEVFKSRDQGVVESLEDTMVRLGAASRVDIEEALALSAQGGRHD
jgi:general secretion pathway protein E